MASVQKFTAKAVPWEIKHIERTIANPTNQDIDSSRTHLNYSLMPQRELSSYEYFKKRKSQLSCYNRADVKVLAGWVVTAPQDLPAEKHKIFFQSVHDFLTNRYGMENCVQSVVHNDESGQPHLHFLFIPVTTDKKNGGLKICANEVITRQELRSFHPDLQNYLNSVGVNATVQSGITKAQGGNKSVRTLKIERNIRHEQEQKFVIVNDRSYDDNRGRW